MIAESGILKDRTSVTALLQLIWNAPGAESKDTSDGAMEGCCSDADRLWLNTPGAQGPPGCMIGIRDAGSFVRRCVEAAACTAGH